MSFRPLHDRVLLRRVEAEEKTAREDLISAQTLVDRLAANVEEAERLFAGISEGGQVTMPLDKTFWAERFGMCIDRFGVSWMVNCEMRAPE